MLENKLILPSNAPNVICRVYLNFHKINTNPQNFYLKINFFKIKGFIQKFYTTKTWNHTVYSVLYVFMMYHLSHSFKKCNILWLNKQTYMFMWYNLPTKFHDYLNNAVSKQLSTHFDLKIYILIMQLPIV